MYTCLAGSAGNHPPPKSSAVLSHAHINTTIPKGNKLYVTDTGDK